MKITVFVFHLVLILGTSLAIAQSPNKDEQAVKARIKQVTDAQLAYDAAALDKIFASDYIEISPLGEFDPRDKVLGFYTPETKAAASKLSASLDITDYSIRSYDKFAIVIARFNFAMVNDLKPLPPRSMRVTFVLRKEKGAWMIASAQYTGIRQVQPPPPKPQ